MPIINCKVEFSLKWYEKCVLPTSGTAATFKITDTKLNVLVVTLKTELISNKNYNENEYIRERLDASIQGVNRLFVFPYMRGNNLATENSYNKYFLPRLKIDNYNIEIDGRNFYDQPINDSIKQYDEIRKISTGQGDDYTTGCLLDFAYFEKKKHRLIAVDLSKQKALDADSRAIQQIIFTGKVSADAIIYYILEKSKETIFEF